MWKEVGSLPHWQRVRERWEGGRNDQVSRRVKPWEGHTGRDGHPGNELGWNTNDRWHAVAKMALPRYGLMPQLQSSIGLSFKGLNDKVPVRPSAQCWRPRGV